MTWWIHRRSFSILVRLRCLCAVERIPREHRAAVRLPPSAPRRAGLDPVARLGRTSPREEWASAQWQRAHCVKNVKQLRDAPGRPARGPLLRRPGARPGRAGHHVDAGAAADDEHDGAGVPRRRDPDGRRSSPRRSTPTRCAGTCCRCSATGAPTGPATRTRPVTRCTSTRCGWPRGSPTATRPRCWPSCCRTCPQYCGHCTRMDLVGNSTPVIEKLKFDLKPVDRYDAMIDYLRSQPGVRDVVVSGGDVANLPWKNLEAFVDRLLRDRQHPGHPAGHQGAHGAAAALAAGRRPGRHGAAGHARPAPAASTWRSTPT